MDVSAASVDIPADARIGPPLDSAYNAILSEDTPAALDALRDSLRELQATLSPLAWSEAVEKARAHPLRALLHEDPFMLRCCSKPRGIAGDSAALDFILRARESPLRPKARIARLHHHITHGPFSQALRFRRDFGARLIDEAAARAARPIRLLFVDGGNLRELDRLKCSATDAIAKLVAFDQDAHALDTVQADYPLRSLATHHGSVRELAHDRRLFADMDLVCCPSLLETLPMHSAKGAVRALFGRLAPGASLYVSNFLTSLPEAALLEVFADWRLALRSRAEIFELVKVLPSESVMAWSYSEDPASHVGFLTVERR